MSSSRTDAMHMFKNSGRLRQNLYVEQVLKIIIHCQY